MKLAPNSFPIVGVAFRSAWLKDAHLLGEAGARRAVGRLSDVTSFAIAAAFLIVHEFSDFPSSVCLQVFDSLSIHNFSVGSGLKHAWECHSARHANGTLLARGPQQGSSKRCWPPAASIHFRHEASGACGSVRLCGPPVYCTAPRLSCGRRRSNPSRFVELAKSIEPALTRLVPTRFLAAFAQPPPQIRSNFAQTWPGPPKIWSKLRAARDLVTSRNEQ